MFDLVIRGGTIIDGTGREAFPADVGIQGAYVRALGDLDGVQAGEILDAQGLTVCPGFIDMHTHSDLSLMEDPRGQSKVRQGVTTELVGQCGFSAFPLRESESRIPPSTMQTTFSADVPQVDWVDLAGYSTRIGRRGSAINIAPLVGHATVRARIGRAPDGQVAILSWHAL